MVNSSCWQRSDAKTKSHSLNGNFVLSSGDGTVSTKQRTPKIHEIRCSGGGVGLE